MNAVNVFAPDWRRVESYGRVALELSAALRRQGYHVNQIGEHAPTNQRLHTVLGGFLLAYPTNFHRFGPLAQHGPRVAVTMFESTQLPPGWSDVLNACDAVIVPSHWLVDVFRDSGVTTPLHVIPLGISTQFRFTPRQPQTPYTFLAIGDRGRRKGWHIAGGAFNLAFGDDPNYRLILKSRPGSLPFTVTNPNVQVIEREMTDRQLAKLYAQADAMIFPTAGEGFGLPPREFVKTGGVAIATNWGGTADDLHRWGLPIQYRLTEAWPDDDRMRGLGQWAEPDADDLARTLRHVADHAAYYRADAETRSRYVGRQYSWRAFGRAAVEVYKGVLHGRSRVSRKLSA